MQNEVCILIHNFRNLTTRFVFKRNKQAKIPKDGIFHNVTLKDPPVKKILKLLMTGRYAVQEKNHFIIVTWFKSQQKPNLLSWAYIMNVATLPSTRLVSSRMTIQINLQVDSKSKKWTEQKISLRIRTRGDKIQMKLNHQIVI